MHTILIWRADDSQRVLRTLPPVPPPHTTAHQVRYRHLFYASDIKQRPPGAVWSLCSL